MRKKNIQREFMEGRLKVLKKIDGGAVYKQILINAKLKTEREVKKKNRANWERSIREAKVRIGP
jgi:hypothetical protein